MASTTEFVGGSVSLGSDGGLALTSISASTIESVWAGASAPPEPGDLMVVVFDGLHTWNGDTDFVTDDPGEDTGWISLDPETGWTRMVDMWRQRPDFSPIKGQRFVVFTRTYQSAGDESFDFDVAPNYVGGVNSWRLRGLVFRPARPYSSGPTPGTNGTSGTWVTPSITVDRQSLAVTIWVGNTSLSSAEGFTYVAMSAIGGMAHKLIEAGTPTMPTVATGLHMGVSFALAANYSGWVRGHAWA